MRETHVRVIGWEDPLEKGTATHSSILAWRIPRTEEPGSYSPWAHKESDMTGRLTHITKKNLQPERPPPSVQTCSSNLKVNTQ